MVMISRVEYKDWQSGMFRNQQRGVQWTFQPRERQALGLVVEDPLLAWIPQPIGRGKGLR